MRTVQGRQKALISVFLLLTSVSTVSIALPDEAAAYSSRGPIEIFNDENFTAANGVTAGNGSWDNPYIISGWEIDLSLIDSSWDKPILAGINIQNTESSFVIRNVFVHSGLSSTIPQSYSPLAGVVLYHVVGARVEDSKFSNNSYGIHSVYSWAVTVSGCDIVDNSMGIYTDGLQGLVVTDNLVARCYYTGVEIDQGTVSSVTNNTITQCDMFGINCYGSEDCTISGNDVTHNVVGLNIGYSNKVKVTENTIADNDNFGLMAYGCTYLTVEENTVSHNKIRISGEEGGTDWVAVTAVTITALAACAVIIFAMLRPKKGSPEVSSAPIQPRL